MADKRVQVAEIIAIVSIGVFWLLYLSGGLAVAASFLAFGGPLSPFIGDLIWVLLSVTAIVAGGFAARWSSGTARMRGLFAALTGFVQLGLLALTIFITSM